jgi:glutathione S-transferase
MKMWGRNTSVNVQKAMWAVDELGLACERIDLAGPFGGNREPAYLAKNPNGRVPTLEEDDGFVLWESNAIVRYLAAKHGRGTLEPADLRDLALAHQWMDWQTSALNPVFTPVFWGLVRLPPEQRDMKAIDAAKKETVELMKMVDAQLAKTACLAGDAFSMGDIPVAATYNRIVQLIPDAPAMPNVDRWFAEISRRKPFRDQVLSVPLK